MPNANFQKLQWKVVIGSINLMFIDVQYQITPILIGSLSMDLLTLETVIFT